MKKAQEGPLRSPKNFENIRVAEVGGMGEVEKPDQGHDVAPYERGLAADRAVMAALTRFLPASVLSLTIVFDFFMGVPWKYLLWDGGAVLEGSGLMTLGYWCALEAMRRWLFPDAAVDGRRSIVAGLVSPLPLVILYLLGVEEGALGAPLILGVTGAALAVLMFFAWLTPTPDMEEPQSLSELRPSGTGTREGSDVL